MWSSEQDYLDDVRKRRDAHWPVEVPREPYYPFGEVSIPEYVKRWAAETPDKPLYNYYGAMVTFGEVDRLSDRFAALLQSHGIGPGDSVAVFMGTCPQFAIAFLGILKAGAVHVPVNPMFREHELLYELNDSNVKLIVADHALVPLVRKVQGKTSLQHVYATGLAELIPDEPGYHVPESVLKSARTSDAESFLNALEQAGEPEAREEDLDALAALNYTGGTTGMPKGCVHTQRDMIYTAATTCRTSCVLERNDTCVNFHPLFWIAGEDLGLIFPMFTGATCVLLARWDALSFMTAVQRYRPNRTAFLVDNIVEVMDHPRVDEFDLSCIESSGVSSFVKKLNREYRERWKALTGSIMIELSYGMTETHTCDSFTRGLQENDFDLDQQPIFVGFPVAGTEFKVCDFESGELVALGTEGEICVRSPSNLKSYWNKPEASAEAIRNGWLHTGDIGAIDDMGLLHFYGRRKEMLKVKGMSVFPAEIEALLGRHAAIIGSGVIGRPDEDRGQVPVAFVLVEPESGKNITSDELRAWCKSAMATYKIPEIRIVDSLPMTATGKVKKGELEKLL